MAIFTELSETPGPEGNWPRCKPSRGGSSTEGRSGLKGKVHRDPAERGPHSILNIVEQGRAQRRQHRVFTVRRGADIIFLGDIADNSSEAGAAEPPADVGFVELRGYRRSAPTRINVLQFGAVDPGLLSWRSTGIFKAIE